MVSPNANDIIVVSPNVQAEQAKKFSKNTPAKQYSNSKYDKSKMLLFYDVIPAQLLTHLRIRPTTHLAGEVSSMPTH